MRCDEMRRQKRNQISKPNTLPHDTHFFFFFFFFFILLLLLLLLLLPLPLIFSCNFFFISSIFINTHHSKQ